MIQTDFLFTCNVSENMTTNFFAGVSPVSCECRTKKLRSPVAPSLPTLLSRSPMTLGLSLNSRLVGLAVLQDETLVEYRVKQFKEHWNPEKLTRMLTAIADYINEFNVSDVAVLLPLRHYTNSETKTLLLKLPALCKGQHVAFFTYTTKNFTVFSQQGRAKKKALMQALSFLYPELSLARKRELTNKKQYYSKLFEAVAVATLHNRREQATANQKE